ncbi:MAG: D-alanyl-D-alanine carboxypeptidase [Firmicutes bacterium]|nr:D-alanyl-D-alanine carboxypeptidase [Bacillota bacterium]
MLGVRGVVLLALVTALTAIAQVGQVQYVQAQAQTPEIELVSKSAVLMDAASGAVFLEKNARAPLPPASITKVMTLTLALEAVKAGRVTMDDLVTASEYAGTLGGSHVWLEAGEQMPLRELLYAVAVGSANDASVAVAEYIAGSEQAFVELMNRKARELGMRDTSFSNATGLPPKDLGMTASHVSSALDVAIMARYAVRIPEFLPMASTWEYKMRKETTGVPVLYNFNRLLKWYDGLDGIKTGMTEEAGYCLAATAKRENLRLIAVVLGSPDPKAREKDIRALLDYGFRRYAAHEVVRRGQPMARARVGRGEPEWVDVLAADDLFVTIERGVKPELTEAVKLSSLVSAPLKKGAPMGKLVVLDKGKEVASVGLEAAWEVRRAGVLKLMFRMTNRLMRSLLE